MKIVRYYKEDRLHMGETILGQLYASQMQQQDLDTKMAVGEMPKRAGDKKLLEVDTVDAYAPPVMPGKILCIGRNYAAHAAELQNDVPEKPLVFAKYPSCVIGHEETVRWRRSITQQVDWEGELAVVIGKRAWQVDEADAYAHIFGYTIANDISARDLQSSESQWVRAKAQDTFCPLGPALVTQDSIDDPHDLTIMTMVNDELMQNGHTGDMIFKIPFLVHYLSQTFTLEPGDVILTGTPPGVGKAQKPPRFLQDGDTVSVTIERIGTLSNPCAVSD